MPAADNVSNRVLRAVLRRDTEELVEAIKRKRLKGVMVALTADSRCDNAKGMSVVRIRPYVSVSEGRSCSAPNTLFLGLGFNEVSWVRNNNKGYSVYKSHTIIYCPITPLNHRQPLALLHTFYQDKGGE